ncbi:hypothetical protein P7K49_032493, partial [Saguinus oedipus]
MGLQVVPQPDRSLLILASEWPHPELEHLKTAVCPEAWELQGSLATLQWQVWEPQGTLCYSVRCILQRLVQQTVESIPSERHCITCRL